MTAYLALFMGFALVIWLMRQDLKARSVGSRALLIPGLWIFIQATHPPSYWWDPAGGAETLFNTLLTIGMIVGAIIVVQRRGLNLGDVANRNMALFLCYGYFALSTIWSDVPLLSMKRIIKDFGLLPVALVFLTEENPVRAIRVVFVRISYILFPLSIITIKWFPETGRVASNSGDAMFRGLATHKNSLGLAVFVLGLMLLWDLIEIVNGKDRIKKRTRQVVIRVSVLLMGMWLLFTCQSKTSLLCLILGCVVFLLAGWAVQKQNGKQVLVGGLVAAALLSTLDSTLGVSEMIIRALGKDPSLTGRTQIWQDVKEQNTDPLFGNGFYVFWDTSKGKTVVEEFMSIKTTHNGYLEIYVDGGICADVLLVLALLSMAARSINRLFAGDPMGKLGFVFWVLAVVYNFSESSFFRPDPMWFTLVLTTLGCPRLAARRMRCLKPAQNEAMLPA